MVYALLAIVGLCLGSFVNALVWRLHEQEQAKQTASKKARKGRASKAAPTELSIVNGRSMCPQCRHQLAPADLIPVVSWLLLRGKCRYCKRPIEDSPLVELSTAALFVGSYAVWPHGFDTAGWVRFGFWLAMLVGFVALVVYDLRWMLLPNTIVFTLTAVAAVQAAAIAVFARDWRLLSGAVFGGLIIGGLFYILFQMSGGRWIGGGDVKLGFMLGLLSGGAAEALLLLFAASTTGSLVSLPLLATGKVKRSSRIPFGPFLLLAAVIVQLWGTQLIEWYQALVLF